MRLTTRACLHSAAAALIGAASAPLAARQTLDTYEVTSISASAGGRFLVHEQLSLERDGERSRLRLAAADGSVLVEPVALTAQGQIASRSQDRGVVCYNMAMNVLAHGAPTDAPPSVFVQFFSSVVQIPLRLRATTEQGSLRTIALDGASTGILRTGDTRAAAGVLIGATVAQADGALRDATFDEVHYVGTPANIIGRSTCTLQRSEKTGKPRTQT